ncbi:MAG TPA: hypothetical protein VF200_09290 [Woeseiaceae bacterium]
MNRRASDDTGATPTQRGSTGGEEAARNTRETAQQAAETGKERLEAGAEQAAGSVDAVAEAVGTAASRLGEMDHEGLADYANRLATWLSEMSGKLRNRNVDEITGDLRGIAERNPALFFLGSIGVGLALSRFAKASGERARADGAAGRPAWTRGDDEKPTESEWTGEDDVATRELEPAEPGISTYEGTDRGTSGRAADRPITPDSSGGGGL